MSKNDNFEKMIIRDKRATILKMFFWGSVVLLLAILLVANILFDNMLGSFFTFDFSSTSQNSITSVTEEYLSTLPSDANIQIVGLMDRPTNLENSPYEYIVPLLDDLQSKSGGRIEVRYMNPQTYPTIISELDSTGIYDLEANTYVVKYNDRCITINPVFDCFTFNNGYPVANLVENAFVNAIVSLTSDSIYKAYFLTGLNEDTHQGMTTVLSSMAITSEDLPVSEDFVIPDDCSILFLNGPQMDIPENVVVKLKDYIQDGGNLVVSVNYDDYNSFEAYTNLNEVLHEVNLHIDQRIISENSPQYQINSAYMFMATVEEQFIGDSNIGFVTAGYARPVRAYDNPYSYIQTAPIFVTTNQATAVTSDNLAAATTIGTYNVGMYGTFSDVSNPPNVFVFGTNWITCDKYINNYGLSDNNVVFIKSILRDLFDVGTSIDIPQKMMSDYSFDTAKATNSNVTMVMMTFMLIIPFVFVVFGVVVYNKRKNL